LQGHGFELDVDRQANKILRLRANLPYHRTENKDTDEIMPDTPEWQFYTDAHWQFRPDWSLNAQCFWIADRHRADGDPRSDIDDYDLVNVTLRRKNIAKHWDLAFSVRNLFDEDAREPSPYDATAADGAQIPNDYPMKGRAVWAEIRFHF